MIDRRKSKSNDDIKTDIYLYEPPNSIYSRNIPNNAASEWGIAASRTCILPSMEYDEKRAINITSTNHLNKDNEKLKNIKYDQETNIHAAFHAKGGLLTFSFQCKSADKIKCYMFYAGQVIRLFVEEIEDIFPHIFKMDRADNQSYFNGDDFKLKFGNIKNKLCDKQFDIFYKAATC